MARQLHAPAYVPYEEWRAKASETALSEWVDGEVVTPMPPAVLHQIVATLLARLFGNFAEAHDLGQVIVPPIELRLARSAREPDLVFLATANLHRLGELRIEGYADLVVEIVSPESARRDRVEKLAEYAAAGIPEYWIFDPRPGRHEVLALQLDPSGRYVPIAPDERGRLRSVVLPGFWFDPAWLRRDPIPGALALFAEMTEDH